MKKTREFKVTQEELDQAISEFRKKGGEIKKIKSTAEEGYPGPHLFGSTSRAAYFPRGGAE